MRALVLVVVGIGSGCFHHQTYLPGVIDMRTDGSGLAPAEPRARASRFPKSAAVDPRLARPGTEALVQGAGLQVLGGDVTVEDRHYWIFGSIPIYNESPTPELQGALKHGALTSVQLGESLDAIDIIASLFVPLVLPVASWVLPSFTFRASARVSAWHPPSPAPAAAPTAPPAPAPPPAPTAPPPPSTEAPPEPLSAPPEPLSPP